MFWSDLQGKSSGVFKRLTGVRRSTFEKMVEVVKEHIALQRKHPTRGKPCKSSVEDRVLMMLMSRLRRDRTFLHTATSFGYSESQGWRIVRKVEDILLSSGVFRLPGKKALLQLEGSSLGRLVVVDVGESPVERPKKSSGAITAAKRSGIPIKYNWSSVREKSIVCR